MDISEERFFEQNDLLDMALAVASNFSEALPQLSFVYDVRLKGTRSVLKPANGVIAPNIDVISVEDHLSFILSFSRNDEHDHEDGHPDNFYPDMDEKELSEGDFKKFYHECVNRMNEQKKLLTKANS